MAYKLKKDSYQVYEIDDEIPEKDRPEVFDLSADADVSQMTDDELLFRESIIKLFYDNAVRANSAVYGFTIEDLKLMHQEIIQEFESRGRDYNPNLDRSQEQ